MTKNVIQTAISKPVHRKGRMRSLILEYLNHIRYDRNFAETTVFGRQKMLFFFDKFAKNQSFSTVLIQKFIRYLAQELKWQPQSVKDALVHIKCFTKWLYFAGRAKEDFGYKIPYPKLPDSLPKIISPQTVKQLYSQPLPTKACKRIWITYNFYFELLAKTGLRKTESKNLLCKDFNFEDGTLHVFGKGRRDTYCLIPPDMIDRLKTWFAERELVPDDIVFIGRDGKVLNNESIRFALQLRARTAGINQRVWPHLLRHFFGTDLLKNGVDVAKVQRLMRHKRITSTQVYLNLVVEDLRKDLEKHSLIEKPLPKLRPRKKSKPMIINIYNPNFYNPAFARWYLDYFQRGGDISDIAPAALPESPVD